MLICKKCKIEVVYNHTTQEFFCPGCGTIEIKDIKEV